MRQAFERLVSRWDASKDPCGKRQYSAESVNLSANTVRMAQVSFAEIA